MLGVLCVLDVNREVAWAEPPKPNTDPRNAWSGLLDGGGILDAERVLRLQLTHLA